MPLTLLHTSPAHIAPFNALRDRIAPEANITHLVREDFLIRAQGGIDAILAGEINDIISGTGGPVLCTCTTIGETAHNAGAIRIDQPMMQKAARIGGPVLMVYCLNSTREPSQALLNAECALIDRPTEVRPLFLGEFWPLFEAGETKAFAAAVASATRAAAVTHRDTAVVVLAQASMAGAAPLLADLAVPVLASPELALRTGLTL